MRTRAHNIMLARAHEIMIMSTCESTSTHECNMTMMDVFLSYINVVQHGKNKIFLTTTKLALAIIILWHGYHHAVTPVEFNHNPHDYNSRDNQNNPDNPSNLDTPTTPHDPYTSHNLGNTSNQLSSTFWLDFLIGK